MASCTLSALSASLLEPLRLFQCYIEYNAYMKDLPESTQISFTLLSVRQKKNKQEEEPLGWVNMRLFNWKGQLIQGKHTMFLWPFPKDFADTINTSGAPGQSNIMSATRIEIEFPDYDCPVQFPDKKTILKFVEILRQREARSSKQPEKIRPVAVRALPAVLLSFTCCV